MIFINFRTVFSNIYGDHTLHYMRDLMDFMKKDLDVLFNINSYKDPFGFSAHEIADEKENDKILQKL